MSKLAGKIGWMDSIDFDDELGHALGGNLVFPDKEDCERVRTCIRASQEEGSEWPCYAKRVIVFDADAWDAALAETIAQVRKLQGDAVDAMLRWKAERPDNCERGPWIDHYSAEVQAYTCVLALLEQKP